MSVFPLKRPSMILSERKKVIIACGGYHTVGLKADGTVVAVGHNDNGQCNVTSWSNIVATAGGTANNGMGHDDNDSHTVGLKADGTVVAVGYNGDSQCNVTSWSNIVAVACGGYHTVGLKADGTVVAVGHNGDSQCNVTSWSNIVAVAGGSNHTVGLKADGTVVATGNNNKGQCNVGSWSNIVAVACGRYHTIGLKADGTVVATGDNNKGQCNVGSWSNIVAVACGRYHTIGLKADGTVVATGDNSKGQCNVGSWSNIVAVAGGGYHTIGLKADGTVVATGNNEDGQCKVSSWKLARYDKKGLLIAKTAINLLGKSKVKGFTISGVQPANTNRKVAFKVNNKWNKLTTAGELSPLPTQAITSDSVLAEGNTVAELTALTNVPSLVGKMVYPAFALYAGSKATVMPTIGMTVKAEIDTTVDTYTKTAYSQEFVLHNERDVLIKDITVDSNTKGNGKITLKARYCTFNEITAGGELTETWSDYVNLLSVINKKCHKLQIKADYQVSVTNGSDSVTLNDVIITYTRDVTAKAGVGTTDLVTLTEKFTNDLTYVHAYIKHKELIDADLKAYVRLQKTTKKADFKLIGYGTGARKIYKLSDKGINQDSLNVYADGKAVYDFDFNTETSEITLLADVDAPINATYEFGWELFNYVEMQKGVSQINDSGAYTTEYAYTIPVHNGELTVTAIKYELIRPEGKVTNEVIGVGTGKRQIIQLPHFARKETIVCNGKWSYDYDSKRLTVIAPADTDIVISYDWIAESPVVYGVMAGWAD